MLPPSVSKSLVPVHGQPVNLSLRDPNERESTMTSFRNTRFDEQERQRPSQIVDPGALGVQTPRRRRFVGFTQAICGGFPVATSTKKKSKPHAKLDLIPLNSREPMTCRARDKIIGLSVLTI